MLSRLELKYVRIISIANKHEGHFCARWLNSVVWKMHDIQRWNQTIYMSQWKMLLQNWANMSNIFFYFRRHTSLECMLWCFVCANRSEVECNVCEKYFDVDVEHVCIWIRNVDFKRVFMLLAKTCRYYLTNVPNYDTWTKTPTKATRWKKNLNFCFYCSRDNTFFHLLLKFVCKSKIAKSFSIYSKLNWSLLFHHSSVQKLFRNYERKFTKEIPVNWCNVNQNIRIVYLISSIAFTICHI